jgi:hypothetical protein
MSWLLTSKDELDKFKTHLTSVGITFNEEGYYFGIECKDGRHDFFSIYKIGEPPNGYYRVGYDGTGGLLNWNETIRSWPSEETKKIIDDAISSIKK